MDLDHFLEMQARQEALDAQGNESDSHDNENAEKTFADRLGLNDRQIVRAINSKPKQLNIDRYYGGQIRTAARNLRREIEASSKPTLKTRLESFRRQNKRHRMANSGGRPIEAAIKQYPLSDFYDDKGRIAGVKVKPLDKDREFIPRDPRFVNNAVAGSRQDSSSGWELREAYRFLDEAIDRDIEILSKSMAKNNRTMKFSQSKESKMTRKESKRLLGAKRLENDVMGETLSRLRNRKDQIRERDLEQSTKSEMRRLELEQVRQGKKGFFKHRLEKTRHGAIKSNTGNPGLRTENGRRVTIQEVYFEKKYEALKKDGRLGKYIQKKRKNVHAKFRRALNKKSGAGWNDS